MKRSLTLPYTAPLTRQTTLALVRAADRLGYDTIRVAEHNAWDPFAVLAHLAGATERIQLATGISNVFSRSPAQLAQSAATVDAVSGGRLTLGLGTSGPLFVREWHGVPYEHPLRRLRETVEIVRLLLRRQPLVYSGEVFSFEGGITFGVKPARDRIPVQLAALTPAGLELAGELADGWLATFFSPIHFPTVLRPHLERGAARAGRRLSELRICVSQPVYVTADVAAARDAARASLVLFIGGMGTRERNFYNQLWQRYGFTEAARRAQDLYLAGRTDEAADAVSDEMVDLVTIIGSVADCRRRLAELEAAGVDEVSLLLEVPGQDPVDLMNALEALAP